MTDDTQDIVGRLRAKTVLHENFGGNGALEQWNNLDGEEAADLIEAQAAEIERLRAALAKIRRMTDKIAAAPMTAERWADRIEDEALSALGTKKARPMTSWVTYARPFVRRRRFYRAQEEKYAQRWRDEENEDAMDGHWERKEQYMLNAEAVEWTWKEFTGQIKTKRPRR